MAITWRVLGKWAAESGGVASFSVPLDSAAVAGEYVVVDVAHSYDGAFTDTVAGYGFLNNSGALSAYSPRKSVHARFATEGEAASVTINKGGSTNCDYDVIVVAYSNVDPSDPLALDPVFALDGQASGSAPTGTPDSGSAPWLAVWSVAHQNYRAAADSDIAWTGAAELAQATSTFNVMTLATEARTDTTAPGTRAWTITPWGGNTPAVSTLYGLREAAAADPGPGAPQLIDSYRVDATAATMTSPSFTPAPGEVILVRGITGDESRTLAAPTNTGTALTFSGNRGPGANNSNYAANYLWSTRVPAGFSGAATISVVANAYAAGVPVTLLVERWSYAKLATTPAVNTPQVGPTSNAAPSSTVTTAAAKSVVSWAVTGWNGTSGTEAYRGTPTIVNSRRIAGTINAWFGYQGAPSAGAQVFGLTAPLDKWTAAGVEIQYDSTWVPPVVAGPEPGRMLLAA